MAHRLVERAAEVDFFRLEIETMTLKKLPKHVDFGALAA